MSNRPLVVIESPYAGATEEDTILNVEYARRCMQAALLAGEAPYASHLLYTQPGVLDDKIPEQRTNGIQAGFAWREKADIVRFHIARGWSRGMIAALDLSMIEQKHDIEVGLDGFTSNCPENVRFTIVKTTICGPSPDYITCWAGIRHPVFAMPAFPPPPGYRYAYRYKEAKE